METYYYDIRKQVFEYDEDEQPAPCGVFRTPSLCWTAAPEGAVIGYGERTMNEIVEAYANPDLPPEEWDLDQLISKVKEFINLLESPGSDSGPGHGGTEGVPAEQLRNAYDQEGQIEQQRPGLMREAERFFILQQIDTLWQEHLQAMDAYVSVDLRGYGEGSADRIQERGLRHVPRDDDQRTSQCDLFACSCSSRHRQRVHEADDDPAGEDEDDILALSLEHHLTQGIDRFIVTDNRSRFHPRSSGDMPRGNCSRLKSRGDLRPGPLGDADGGACRRISRSPFITGTAWRRNRRPTPRTAASACLRQW